MTSRPHFGAERASVTLEERAHWAEVRLKMARRRAAMHPDDRAYQLAADSRQRELEALRRLITSRTT